MKIQLNTDKNITGGERLESYLSSLIENELSHFSNHITRIEVHLSDENGQKKGANDKRCLKPDLRAGNALLLPAMQIRWRKP